MLFPRQFRPSAHLLRPGEDRLGAQLILTREKARWEGAAESLPGTHTWWTAKVLHLSPLRMSSDFRPLCPSR